MQTNTIQNAGLVPQVPVPMLLRRPFRLALSGFMALVILVLIGQLAAGRTPFSGEGLVSDLLIALLHCALLAYLAGAYLVIVFRGERACARLRQSGSVLPESALHRCLPPLGKATAGWWLSGAAGLLFGFLGPWLTEPQVGDVLWFWDVRHWTTETFWHRLLGVSLCFIFGLFVYALVNLSLQMSRITERLPEIDLFRPEHLAPLTNQALTNGLLVAGLIGLVGLFGLDHGLTVMLALLGTVTLFLMTVVIILPLRGAHRRLRQAKRAAMEWCESEIGRARAAMGFERPESGETSERGRLADLMAYRQLIESVREWPFGTRALRTATLYFLIPLVSWFMAAVVQTLIAQFLLTG